VILVLDSCRFDAVTAASTPQLDRLGTLEQRWAYASWTAPSHYNLLMGLLPHTSPRGVFASQEYRKELLSYRRRLGIEDLDYEEMLPQLFLPTWLRKRGYRTCARVSLPVLNPATPLNIGFDSYELMERHNDLGAILEAVPWEGEGPLFALLNTGETHYPYATVEEAPEDWPRVSGLHGVFKHLGDRARSDLPEAFFSRTELDALRARQIAAVASVDALLEQLYERAPADAWIVVTSDHGELFGEDDYFGHGPIAHDLVLQVPFVEGPNPRGR